VDLEHHGIATRRRRDEILTRQVWMGSSLNDVCQARAPLRC
jgi:hypothetical protein